MAYTTVEDIELLFRPFKSEQESARAEALIDTVEDMIRQYAMNQNKNLDLMIAKGQIIERVFVQVVVDVVARTLMTSTDQEPMTQYSESALGYSVSGSFLNAGGGIFIKKDEYKMLGLRKQRIGAIRLD